MRRCVVSKHRWQSYSLLRERMKSEGAFDHEVKVAQQRAALEDQPLDVLYKPSGGVHGATWPRGKRASELRAGDKIVLPSDGEGNPRERCDVLEVGQEGHPEIMTVCVIPEDRGPDDADGLREMGWADYQFYEVWE